MTTITTPSDMTVLNDLDRFHLALDVVERVARLAAHVDPFRAWVQQRLAEHERYIRQRGEDLPEIRDWRWSIAGSLTP